ncbi:hypothetical protein BpHYR1_025195 [Brachionus plicatilis]|uniref:Uncharacterized protein n=1 Tax=Brachionus plicatilis TaxID=10195 RepID=A0A3M7SVJ3_BRAPC|nr:hypothetical protein BpHYR1_025195 [Brachionus plicatilis]
MELSTNSVIFGKAERVALFEFPASVISNNNQIQTLRWPNRFCLKTPNSLTELDQIFRLTPLARGVNEEEGFQYHAYLSYLRVYSLFF